jgi:hypothetical protein
MSRTIQAYQSLKYWMPDYPSHTAWLDDERPQVIEAWTSKGPSGKRGVQCVPSLDTLHTPGTRVELFNVVNQTPESLNRVREFLTAQVGKPYDWYGILCGFGLHRAAGDPSKSWFCSELVSDAHYRAGTPLLLRLPAWKQPPCMVQCSPLLRIAGVWVCGAGIVDQYRPLPAWVKQESKQLTRAAVR